MTRLRPCIPAFQRFAALTCAAAYLLGGTELLPELLAFGAWLEGSHSVRLACNERNLTVVLSHDRGTPSRLDYHPGRVAANPLHRHGVAARVFCLFATSGPTTPDHIASFAGATACERTGSSLKSRSLTSVNPTAIAFTSPQPAKSPQPLSAADPARFLPIISSAALLGTRFTVLVI